MSRGCRPIREHDESSVRDETQSGKREDRFVQLRPYGPRATLVEVDDTEQALQLAEWARGRGLARDVVPGAGTVLLDGVGDPGQLAESLAGWRAELRPLTGDEVTLEVVYDGPDLDGVAGLWGCDVDEVVSRHQRTTFVSAFCGFAPGFAYLSGLADAVPRLETPRTRVPAGAVALADTWCGVYPVASPGGWRVIGTTQATLWDPTGDQPALLAPGTRVRFVAR
jgi:KipI family sensor histidine kinase inhibitor